MTGLIKGIATAVGTGVTIIAATVISKNNDERKKWLDEMGDKVEGAFDTMGKYIDKAGDELKKL